jgi:YD repeat-containing protein
VISDTDPLTRTSSYTYDALNPLTQDSRSSGSTTWSYNAADELTDISDTGKLGWHAKASAGRARRAASLMRDYLTMSC